MARRVRDGAGDVLLGARCAASASVVAEREAGRDRRRKRAPGAVRVAAVDARRTELVERVSVEQQVDDLRAGVRGSMAAGDDDRRGAHVANRAAPPRAHPPLTTMRRPLNASASGMFGVTTRARGSSSVHHRLHAILVEQPLAALGDHHRIDDDERQIQLRDRRGHRFDDRRGGQHAGLRRVDRNVAGDRLDLRRDEVGAQRSHRLDAQRVLHGDGGDRAGAVDAERGKRLQVGLDAGAAAGVAARNCQRYRIR